jgi:hypothetical protein
LLKYTFLLLVFPLLIPGSIRLENPSFEGEPQDATVPTGWMPCEEGTTPDILPGPWGVYQEASDGETYLGLITRPDGTFESIGQRLSAPMDDGECYSFSIDLARSNTYTGYNKPLQLRMWGAVSRCKNAELLYESPVIEHTDWKSYSFSFATEFKHNYIILEAYAPDNMPVKGNILLDNCSKVSVCKRA